MVSMTRMLDADGGAYKTFRIQQRNAMHKCKERAVILTLHCSRDFRKMDCVAIYCFQAL